MVYFEHRKSYSFSPQKNLCFFIHYKLNFIFIFTTCDFFFFPLQNILEDPVFPVDVENTFIDTLHCKKRVGLRIIKMLLKESSLNRDKLEEFCERHNVIHSTTVFFFNYFFYFHIFFILKFDSLFFSLSHSFLFFIFIYVDFVGCNRT